MGTDIMQCHLDAAVQLLHHSMQPHNVSCTCIQNLNFSPQLLTKWVPKHSFFSCLTKSVSPHCGMVHGLLASQILSVELSTTPDKNDLTTMIDILMSIIEDSYIAILLCIHNKVLIVYRVIRR